MRHGTIWVCSKEWVYSGPPHAAYDWSWTVYGEVKEETWRDAPRALGKHMVLISYVEANLQHDLTTGRYFTGAILFLNQTPIELFTMKQPMVKMPPPW